VARRRAHVRAAALCSDVRATRLDQLGARGAPARARRSARGGARRSSGASDARRVRRRRLRALRRRGAESLRALARLAARALRARRRQRRTSSESRRRHICTSAAPATSPSYDNAVGKPSALEARDSIVLLREAFGGGEPRSFAEFALMLVCNVDQMRPQGAKADDLQLHVEVLRLLRDCLRTGLLRQASAVADGALGAATVCTC
jgi:hypothetical protein